MTGKKPWLSKTLWINLIALAAILVQVFTGNEIFLSAETQATLLAVINIIVRLITKVPIEWKMK